MELKWYLYKIQHKTKYNKKKKAKLNSKNGWKLCTLVKLEIEEVDKYKAQNKNRKDKTYAYITKNS